MFDYKKYKWFFTKSGKLVVGGKSAESNDKLLSELKDMRKELIVMHTKSPGSPFCAIIAPINAITGSDMDECATFTGCFSRAWKEGQKSTVVHIFKLSQLSKEAAMNAGTWQVKGKVKDKTVDLKLVIAKQDGVVKALPKETANESDVIAHATPGKIDKTKVKIEKDWGINREDLLAALPAGGVKFSKT